ncbi:uncharacterized protein LOC119666487 [Teleopsis dalmanni]|uniref:uncharacterized protein LOC119666487 n=1 Tax=Teleopsis dalmanni TaxID=139649 RepID=UPI0018CF3954|nr:uncharacterized protein LOC119666487 [Teleopsis dalmanni]
MYRQIQIHPDDRRFQNIWWREHSNEKLRLLQLSTVTYGTRTAPYLATKCPQTLAINNKSKYPLGAAALETDFYVDDGLCGANTITEAVEIKNQLINIQTYKVRKWSANHQQLLHGISPEDQEVDLNLLDEEHTSVKTLGIIWLPKSDHFRIKVNTETENKVTKRIICSELARIFDPVGLVNPVTVQAKMFVQRLWQLQLDWDETLPEEMHPKWDRFRSKLKELQHIQIPRHVNNQSEKKNPKTTQLHVFCDASQGVYGVAVYIRSSFPDGTIGVQLLASKSRVAPLKTQLIPRLELCATLLGANFPTRIKTDLHLEQSKMFLWSDSEITLYWINSEPSKYQVFVANRIVKIQELTLSEQWRHVSSKLNPADMLSRGVNPQDLELETVVIQIEAILNSRPITPQSSDLNDLIALTPGHFLIGEPLTAMQETSSVSSGSLPSRWKASAQIQQTFGQDGQRNI